MMQQCQGQQQLPLGEQWSWLSAMINNDEYDQAQRVPPSLTSINEQHHRSQDQDAPIQN